MAVPIPRDCRDGFNEAYYGRPEMFLQADARLACSAWSFVEATVVASGIAALERALGEGEWDNSHAALRTAPSFAGSLRLVVGRR